MEHEFTVIEDTNEDRMYADVQVILDKFEEGDSLIVIHITSKEQEKAILHDTNSAGVIKASKHLTPLGDTFLKLMISSIQDLAKVDPDAARQELETFQLAMVKEFGYENLH